MATKDFWDLESAVRVLEHPTVDSKLWAEAVEWLLINGPAEIRKILLEASLHATNHHFPELKPSHYTVDGQPVYNVAELAKALNTSEKNVQNILKDKDNCAELSFFPDVSSKTVH